MSYLKGSQRSAVQCHEGKPNVKWRSFIHAQYLNCYTFDISPELQNNVTTLEMFIYLDENMNSTTCIDCFHAEIKSQLSGAVIAVHTPGTFPDLNGRSINVSPGTLTEITLQNILNIQKAPPYGRCSPKTPDTVSMYGYNVSYSEFACRQITIQKAINDKCGCRAIEYPYFNTETPFCSSMPIFVPKGSCEDPNVFNASCIAQMKIALHRINCKISVIKQFNKDVVETCTLPCSFHSYETDRSVSTWPTKLWQIEWLQSKFAKSAGMLNRREFEPYKRIITMQSLGHNGDAMDLLYRTSVLERNLLALLINRPNFNLHKVEEKEVLSLTSFLSQSGGLFSIWLGLTMISIVEVIELFVNCCAGGGSNRRSHSQKHEEINCKQSLSIGNFR